MCVGMYCLICSRALHCVFTSRPYHCTGLHFRRRTATTRLLKEQTNVQFFVSVARRGVFRGLSFCVRMCTYNTVVVAAAGTAENVRCTCVLFLSTLLVLNNAEHIIPITRCEIKRGEDEERCATPLST